MDGLSPLVMEVYDKDFVYQGMISRPQEVTLTARHNAVGGGAFTLDSDDDAVDALVSPGANVVCKYRHDPDNLHSPMYFVGGPVSQVDLGGTLGAPTRAFTLIDWWDILNKIICRAVPGSGLGSQGGASTFHTVTGPMETVVKTLVSANLATVPTPLTVAATHGWGETVTVQARMNKLTDKILPALNFAHVGLSVQMTGSGLVLDAYNPTVHTIPLDVDSGILTKAAGSLLRPTVSRVLVRGGEDPSAVFQQYINTAVEAEWGFCGWEFLDVTESTTTSYLEAKAWEVLNAGGRQSSVSIELAETADWGLGLSYDLGDEVPFLLPAMTTPVVDVIAESELNYGVGSGLTVQSRIGDKPAAPNQILAKAVQKVAARQRITQARG